MIEYIIVFGIVAIAAFFAIRHIYWSVTGKDTGCGCEADCNCSHDCDKKISKP
jgi:hypothetical protein